MPLNFWARFPKNPGAASWEPLTGMPTTRWWRTSLRNILFAALKKKTCGPAAQGWNIQRYFMKSAPAGPCRLRCAQRFSLAELFPLHNGRTQTILAKESAGFFRKDAQASPKIQGCGGDVEQDSCFHQNPLFLQGFL